MPRPGSALIQRSAQLTEWPVPGSSSTFLWRFRIQSSGLGSVSVRKVSLSQLCLRKSPERTYVRQNDKDSNSKTLDWILFLALSPLISAGVWPQTARSFYFQPEGSPAAAGTSSTPLPSCWPDLLEKCSSVWKVHSAAAAAALTVTVTTPSRVSAQRWEKSSPRPPQHVLPVEPNRTGPTADGCLPVRRAAGSRTL